MATLQQLKDQYNQVISYTGNDLRADQLKAIAERTALKIQQADPSWNPAPAANVAPAGMREVGATVDGVRYIPEVDFELADKERALKEAGLITSRYNVPFIKTPERVNAHGVSIPAVIDRRPGTVADFMSGSNPYETYTSPGAIPEIDPLTGTPEVANDRTPRPAMYFGGNLPPITPSQEEYMRVMELSSLGAGVPRGIPSAKMQPVPTGTVPPLPTATPMIADWAIPEVGGPEITGIIGDPRFAGPTLKPLDADVIRQVKLKTNGDATAAKSLLSQMGYAVQ